MVTAVAATAAVTVVGLEAVMEAAMAVAMAAVETAGG